MSELTYELRIPKIKELYLQANPDTFRQIVEFTWFHSVFSWDSKEEFFQGCLNYVYNTTDPETEERTPTRYQPGTLNKKSGLECTEEYRQVFINNPNFGFKPQMGLSYDVDRNILCSSVRSKEFYNAMVEVYLKRYIDEVTNWDEVENPEPNPDAVPIEEFSTASVVESLSPEQQSNIEASTPTPKQELNGDVAAVQPDPSIASTLFDQASSGILDQIGIHVSAAMEGKPSQSDNAFLTTPAPSPASSSDEPPRQTEAEQAAIAEEAQQEQQQLEENAQALLNEQVEQANEEQAEKDEKESSGAMEKIEEAKAKVNEIKEKALEKVQEAVNKAQSKANELQEKAQTATIDKLKKKFDEIVNKAVEKEKGKVHELAESLGEDMMTIMSAQPIDPEEFAKAVNKLQERAVDGARKIAENIKESIDEQGAKLTSAIQLELYQDKISKQAEKIQSKLKEALDKAQAAIAKAMNKVDSAIKKVLGKLNALAGK